MSEDKVYVHIDGPWDQNTVKIYFCFAGGCFVLLSRVWIIPITALITSDASLPLGNASILASIEALNICFCILYLRRRPYLNFNVDSIILKIFTAVVIVNLIISAAIIVLIIRLCLISPKFFDNTSNNKL